MSEQKIPTFKCKIPRNGMGATIEFEGQDISRLCTSIKIEASVDSITSISLGIMPEFVTVELEEPLIRLRESVMEDLDKGEG